MTKDSIQLYNSEKYLGIKIDEGLTWNKHINDIAIKLSQANAILCKVREFVNQFTMLFLIVIKIMQIQSGVKTKIH